MSTITGDKKIDRQLRRIGSKTVTNKVIRAGQGKMMTELSRGIRNAIPPKYKSAKKTVGRNTKKKQAKVGLGVGKRTKSKKQRDPKKPGVGISKQNIHWLVLGTKFARAVGLGWLKQGVANSEQKAMREGQAAMRAKVEQELKKA